MAFLRKNNLKKIGKANIPNVGAPTSEKNGGGFFSGHGHKFYTKKGSRYSLVIGDEGAILCYIDGSEVKSRNFIASVNEENLKDFALILEKDQKAPLYVVIDSMDQSFVQQTLPPISAMGVDKMIKRRLDRDFGKDAIKGYVLLDRETTGRRDWHFLMVALEKSANIVAWLSFIEKIGNRLAGIYLLSVEVEHIINAIDSSIQPAVTKPKRKSKKESINEPPKWKLFISNNKVGGVRQVVLKNGKIIFTRLTQNVGDLSADVIAGNIEQEVSSTIEYMKRLSYNTQHSMEIYVVASDEVNHALDISNVQAKNIYKFSPFELSELLGIVGATQRADQFGDVILSVLIASSRKHRLRLIVPSAQKVDSLYKIILFERAFAGLAVLCMLGYGGMEGLELWQKYSSLEDLEQQKNSQQRRLDGLKEDVKNSNLDIKKISETNKVYKKVIGENLYPSDAIFRVHESVISSVSIKSVTWNFFLGSKESPLPPNTYKQQLLLSVEFPAEAGTEDGLAIVAKKLLHDLQEKFPEYDVFYTKLPELLQKKNEAGSLGFGDEDAKKDVKIDQSKLEAAITIVEKEAHEMSFSKVGMATPSGNDINSLAPKANDAGSAILLRNSRLDILRKERKP